MVIIYMYKSMKAKLILYLCSYTLALYFNNLVFTVEQVERRGGSTYFSIKIIFNFLCPMYIFILIFDEAVDILCQSSSLIPKSYDNKIIIWVIILHVDAF
jgi:hypothetical protein